MCEEIAEIKLAVNQKVGWFVYRYDYIWEHKPNLAGKYKRVQEQALKVFDDWM